MTPIRKQYEAADRDCGNATPGKAIYLDGFIYEEGIPIGKCYLCPSPHPFTNNQVLTEGIDYVKQWQRYSSVFDKWENCSKNSFVRALPSITRIKAIPIQASDKPVANPHECPECSWQCTCNDQPCSCCHEALPP